MALGRPGRRCRRHDRHRWCSTHRFPRRRPATPASTRCTRRSTTPARCTSAPRSASSPPTPSSCSPIGFARHLARRTPRGSQLAQIATLALTAGVGTLIVGFGLKAAAAGGMQGGIDQDFYTKADSTVISTIAGQMQYVGWQGVAIAMAVTAIAAFKYGAFARWIGVRRGDLLGLRRRLHADPVPALLGRPRRPALPGPAVDLDAHHEEVPVVVAATRRPNRSPTATRCSGAPAPEHQPSSTAANVGSTARRAGSAFGHLELNRAFDAQPHAAATGAFDAHRRLALVEAALEEDQPALEVVLEPRADRGSGRAAAPCW